MSNETQHAQAVIKNSHRISPVWLLPIIALLIVGWLGWRAVSDAGVEIHVQFNSGQGIKAGKTEVIHNGLVVGTVKELTATTDMKAVDAVITMAPQYQKYLKSNTQFWLVKPQVSMAGISGLETLVSGNFIAFNPSETGKVTTYFKALEQAPPISEDDGGLTLTLCAKEMSSLGVGSPVYFRRYKVGEVMGYDLSRHCESAEIEVYIESKFAYLVKKNTRFWNASGIDISGSLSNLEVRTQSLLSIIQGGVAFYTPDWEAEEKPAENQDQYELYENYAQAESGIPITIEFPLNVTLGSANTLILFHGFEVGRVQALDISDDLTRVIVKAVMRPEAASALVEGAQFWVEEPRIGPKGISGLDTLINGRYINTDISPHDKASGKPTRYFTGLSKRPPAPASALGLHLTLTTDSLSGLSEGSPVLFRNIPVGTVQDYAISRKKGVEVRLLIEPEFEHLINESTRFWDVSGVSVDAGLSGVKIRSATLSTLLSGGVAFSTPEPQARKVKDGTRFALFKDENSATEKGTTLIIQFETAEGLNKGSLLKYRGMNVGRVTRLEIDRKTQAVVASVFLELQYKWLAAEGSQFWLVKPKLGLANTSHLETLVTGPYIDVQPMEKKRPAFKRQFIAINHEPRNQRRVQGLDMELVSKRLGSVRRGNPVYYRDIPVGIVTGYGLGNPADHVVIFINIEDRYAGLISDRSQFWNASGIDLNVGLFTGAKVRTESLEALLAGGIAFATPDVPGKIVPEGKRFKLHRKVDTKWLEWHPDILLKN